MLEEQGTSRTVQEAAMSQPGTQLQRLESEFPLGLLVFKGFLISLIFVLRDKLQTGIMLLVGMLGVL